MLAFALVLIFVLWLIDKHNKWRAAAKIFFGLVGLAVLGLAGVWGWDKYESWKEEKAQALAAAQGEAAVKACVKRFSAKGVFDTSPCELDPSAQPQPPVTVNDWVPVEAVRPKPPRLKRVRNTGTFDVPMTTTEYGSLNCGTISRRSSHPACRRPHFR